MVFPTRESRVFLEPLAALPGEEPWIYTQGIGLALDFLGLTFEQLLPWVKEAARILGTRTVQGKDALDQALAGAVEPHLPPDKLPLWRTPTMYGGAGPADGWEARRYPSCCVPAPLRGWWCSAGGRASAPPSPPLKTG